MKKAPMSADGTEVDETGRNGSAAAWVTKVFTVIGKVNHFVAKVRAENEVVLREHSCQAISAPIEMTGALQVSWRCTRVRA